MRCVSILIALAAWSAVVSDMYSEPMTDLSGADSELRSMVSYAPSPEYSYKARALHLAGSGMISLEIDKQSGRVKSAGVEKSTGHKILDDAALAAFKRWRFNAQKMQEAFARHRPRFSVKQSPSSPVWTVRIPVTFVYPVVKQ